MRSKSILLIICSFLYFSNISCSDYIELDGISDIDLNREIPTGAPLVEFINEDILDSIIRNNKRKYTFLHFWSLSRPCVTEVNSDKVNRLLESQDSINYILISFDLNAKNMKKALRLSLDDIGVKFKSYLLDYDINLTDLKNEDNLMEFIDEFYDNEFKSIFDYPIGFLITKDKGVIKTFDKVEYDSLFYKFNHELN